MSIQLVEHPLIRHYLGRARDLRTSCTEFADLIERIASLMVPTVTANLETEAYEVETPLEQMRAYRLARPLMLVPILRAGLGMVDGFSRLLPTAAVAHLGLYRNEETLEPVVYYKKLPASLARHELIVLDPMLATGGTACAAISYLKERQAARLRFVCVLAAPEGVEQLSRCHPDVPIIGAAMDRELNSQGYILPGLGDAGDRIFGTMFSSDEG